MYSSVPLRFGGLSQTAITLKQLRSTIGGLTVALFASSASFYLFIAS
jgi:hypothetical protein